MRFRTSLLVALTFALVAAGPGIQGPVTGFLLDKANSLAPQFTHSLTGAVNRQFWSIQSDRINVMDYGAEALPLNATQIGSRYGTSYAAVAAWSFYGLGSTPFAFVTDPRYGLVCTMVTQTDTPAGSTSLNFLVLGDASNQGLPWARSVPYWLQGANENCIPDVGSLLSLPSAPATFAANAAITAIPSNSFTISDNNTGVADTIPYPTGAISFATPTTADIPAQTPITITVPFSTFQSYTVDWLAIQAAHANAYQANQPGMQVVAPHGRYNVNRDIVNPTVVTNTAQNYQSVRFVGDGENETQISVLTDLGMAHRAYGFPSRDTGAATATLVADLSIIGPQSSFYGYGHFPIQEKGLEVGPNMRASNVHVSGFHCSFCTLGDHWHLNNVTGNGSDYGLYFEAGSNTMGNETIDGDSSFKSNWSASIAVNPTNQIDNSQLLGFHTGSSLYAFYYEPPFPGTTQTLSNIIHQSTLKDVYVEQVCREAVHGFNLTGNLDANQFYGDAWYDIGRTGSYMVGNGGPCPNDSGNYVPKGLMAIAGFTNELLDGTNFYAPSVATSAFIVANNVLNIVINDDVNFIDLATQALPSFSAATLSSVSFTLPNQIGYFESTLNAQSYAAGLPMQDTGHWADLYQDGKPYAGMSLIATNGLGTPSGNLTHWMPIVTTCSGCRAVKANSANVYGQSQPLYPTAIPNVGYAPGLDNTDAAAVSWNGVGAGATTDTVSLVRGGGGPSIAQMTIGGSTCATAAPVNGTIVNVIGGPGGTGLQGSVVLAPVAPGRSVKVVNQTTGTIQVCPQSGSLLNGASAALSQSIGASRTFFLDLFGGVNWSIN